MARILGCQAKEPFANVGALSDIESCQSQALEGAKPRLAQKMICASHPFGHNSGIDLHNRMISPRALGHNKFLVICDKQGKARWVWTGSQNWTKTGLCTQTNNSVLIDDSQLATDESAARDYWSIKPLPRDDRKTGGAARFHGRFCAPYARSLAPCSRSPRRGRRISTSLAMAKLFYAWLTVRCDVVRRWSSNQLMKPRAPWQCNFSVFATTPCRGLFR